MNKPALFFSLLAWSVLGSGCVGPGPNSQRGAMNGGLLGAVAGAVIGHNSRGGDVIGGAILGSVAGAVVGGAIGDSVDVQHGTNHGYPDDRGYRRGRLEQPPQPPAPLTETVSAPPASNAIWIPGYWAYDGRGYLWVGGVWEIPPPGARAYVAAHWEYQGDRYVYVQSSWR